MRRVITGIQPSGDLHLGNYLGAIRPLLDLQDSEHDVLVFVADLHAMTTSTDGEELRQCTKSVVAHYVALGLDPSKVQLFRQSRVRAHTELAWALGCRAPMGLLERAHSYKDKVANGLSANVGLFYYPVLMAADILLHKAEIVPVGKDQVQHVEIARDLAGYLNNTYGTDLLLPEAQLGKAQYVPGLDGKKMSKSYRNTIPVMATGTQTKKLVGRIVTQTAAMGDPLDPETCNVLGLLQHFADDRDLQEIKDCYRKGRTAEGNPLGFGHIKQALTHSLNDHFDGARERYLAIMNNTDSAWDDIDAQLTRTEQALSEEASAHLHQLYTKMGLR